MCYNMLFLFPDKFQRGDWHVFVACLAAVQNDKGKWGYINTNGKVVIPYNYDWVGDFSDGTASVEIRKTTYSIDHTGKKYRHLY